MDNRTTSAAGLSSSRGTPLFGKAAFAVAALVLRRHWPPGSPISTSSAWLRNPLGKFAKSVPPLSFDDRFGSGSARNSPSIRYPSRPTIRPRKGFRRRVRTHRKPVGRQSPMMRTASPQPAPISRSRDSASAVAAGRGQSAVEVDPPPAPSESRTMFQEDKLADLVPMRFTLASLTPGDGCSASKSGALGYDSRPLSTTSRRGRFTCQTAPSSRRIRGSAA